MQVEGISNKYITLDKDIRFEAGNVRLDTAKTGEENPFGLHKEVILRQVVSSSVRFTYVPGTLQRGLASIS